MNNRKNASAGGSGQSSKRGGGRKGNLLFKQTRDFFLNFSNICFITLFTSINVYSFAILSTGYSGFRNHNVGDNQRFGRGFNNLNGNRNG